MRKTCSRTTVCSNSHLNWPVKSAHTSDVKLPSKSAFWLGTLQSVLLGVRNIYIFPSNLSKCLKWLQKALFTLCCCFSGPFSQNFSFGAPVNSHETFILYAYRTSSCRSFRFLVFVVGILKRITRTQSCEHNEQQL